MEMVDCRGDVPWSSRRSGANEATTGPRGIHGDIEQVLFPVLHGTLWYTGMSVVPPLVINGVVGMSDETYPEIRARLHESLQTLPTAEPIAYRSQNGGDYDEHLVLREDCAPGEVGIHVHYRRSGVDTQCTARG